MTLSQTARRLAALTTIGLAAVALTGCSLITSALNGGESDVFTLKVGDCLNDGESADEMTTVPVVPCDEPHDSELYAAATMEGDEYPGVDETIDFADEACLDEFEDFVGVSYEESIYGYGIIYPSEDSWAGGDREVLCSIGQADENGDIVKLEGSLEGVAE
jgi:hypothetical protein